MGQIRVLYDPGNCPGFDPIAVRVDLCPVVAVLYGLQLIANVCLHQYDFDPRRVSALCCHDVDYSLGNEARNTG